MKLENQVPTIELCKELKELGYKQEGLFWWDQEMVLGKIVEDGLSERVVYDPTYSLVLSDRIRQCVAPTVSEMLGILIKEPIQIMIEEGRLMLFSENYDVVDIDNPAQAMAKMLIYLAENDFIDFKQK